MAIIFGAIYLFLPNSTATVALNSVSKLHVLCMIVTLLARIRIQQEYKNNQSGENNHSKSMPSALQDSAGQFSLASDTSHASQVHSVTLYEGAESSRALVGDKIGVGQKVEQLV